MASTPKPAKQRAMRRKASGSIETLAKHFKYLDNLRESGITNMLGASPFLARAHKLPKEVASDVLGKWMRTFDGNKTPLERASALATSPTAHGALPSKPETVKP